MSEHAPVKVKPADDPAFKLPESLSGLALPLCGGGFLAMVIGVIIASYLAPSSMPRYGMSSYLTAFLYCLTIALGGLFFVLIQHLCRAGWSIVVRRLAEFMMVMIFPLAVLFTPILFAVWFSFGELPEELFVWESASYGADNHIAENVWEAKSGYLDGFWFTVRAIIYFAIWLGLAVYYWRGSTGQDETGEKAVTDKMQYWSGPAVMIFALSMSFAAFDWGMSLAPMWFSTMFGVYIFAGSCLAAHSAIALGAYLLQRCGALKDEITPEHYHDLGKYMFGFVFFWTYISFSQFMLIWYGNIPEETVWFFSRWHGGFGWLSVLLIFLHWMVPFLGTMSRHVRRNPTLVAAWAAYILIMHFIDIFWIVMPEARTIVAGTPTTPEVSLGGMIGVVLCTAGMAALLVGLMFKVASATRVIPARDPRLAESIGFENI